MKKLCSGAPAPQIRCSHWNLSLARCCLRPCWCHLQPCVWACFPFFLLFGGLAYQTISGAHFEQNSPEFMGDCWTVSKRTWANREKKKIFSHNLLNSVWSGQMHRSTPHNSWGLGLWSINTLHQLWRVWVLLSQFCVVAIKDVVETCKEWPHVNDSFPLNKAQRGTGDT
jgi:hypothetical protein